MIIITLTKVPQSLRGDLTKWYQEVQTGVYVGNVSARIRDLLWERVLKGIGNGEATMVYNANNELGYQIKTTRTQYEVVDFDGIPLMMRLNPLKIPVKHGFSNAAKFHKAKVMTHKVSDESRHATVAQLVALDVETTGLDVTKNSIISIGAAKYLGNDNVVEFQQLVKIDEPVPDKITELTGISSAILADQGVTLEASLLALRDFIEGLPVTGYNLHFDQSFLSMAFSKLGQNDLNNQMVDLMPVVKKADQFLDNYRLETVLREYHINNSSPHHALSDAKATLALALKLIKNGHLSI